MHHRIAHSPTPIFSAKKTQSAEVRKRHYRTPCIGPGELCANLQAASNEYLLPAEEEKLMPCWGGTDKPAPHAAMTQPYASLFPNNDARLPNVPSTVSVLSLPPAGTAPSGVAAFTTCGNTCDSKLLA